LIVLPRTARKNWNRFLRKPILSKADK